MNPTGFGIGIFRLDTSGRLVAFSPLQWPEYPERAYSLQEIVELPDRIIPKEDLCRLREGIRKACQGQLAELEHRMICKDGTIVWLRTTLSPNRDSKGRVLGVNGVSVNITNSKHTNLLDVVCRADKELENKLQDDCCKYRIIADHMLDMVCWTDLNGIIQYASPSYKQVLGYDPEQLVGQSAFLCVHPDDQPHALDAFKNLLTNRQGRMEMRLLGVDGAVRWVEVVGTVINNTDGEPCGMICSSRDISTRKKYEHQLKTLIQQLQDVIDFLPDATFVIDRNRNVIAWNRGMEELTGVPKQNILGKPNYSKAVCGERLPMLIDYVMQGDLTAIQDVYPNLKREGHILSAEFSFCGSGDAPQKYLWLAASPLLNDQGEQIGALQSLRDITAQKWAQVELDKQRVAFAQTLVSILDTRDLVTIGHIDRLQMLMVGMAAELDLAPELIDNLRLLAQCHDIGKVAIPDNILLKQDSLLNEDWDIAKRHCEFGYQIARCVPTFEHIADLILLHHERWDGKGYPYGLKGTEIPLECRILAIADAYDTMTNDQPYRKAIPHKAAIAELKRCAGTQFDPKLVETFIRLVDDN